MQNPIITQAEGIAVLEVAISCFECRVSISKPIRRFISRNYTVDDFRDRGIDPESFTKWLNA